MTRHRITVLAVLTLLAVLALLAGAAALLDGTAPPGPRSRVLRSGCDGVQ